MWCVILQSCSVCSHVLHALAALLLHVIFFCRPKSDTCKTCNSLSVRIAAEGDQGEKLKLESELTLHHCKAERAYN